eukprot:350255-Chlamydomonas_euryale.AAC.37
MHAAQLRTAKEEGAAARARAERQSAMAAVAAPAHTLPPHSKSADVAMGAFPAAAAAKASTSLGGPSAGVAVATNKRPAAAACIGADGAEPTGGGDGGRSKRVKKANELKAPKKPKELLPGVGTANYAFLVTLYASAKQARHGGSTCRCFQQG